VSDLIDATSLDETPVFFPSGDESLFGIITRPVGEPLGVGVILIYGGEYTMSAVASQLWPRIARRLAGQGFHVLRYDHHGNGDSSGVAHGFDHRHPYVADLEAAIEFMRLQGLSRFGLLGACLGARASLVCASSMSDVESLFLMSATVHDARIGGKDEEWAERYGVTHYLRRAVQWRTLRKLRDPVIRRAFVRVAAAKIKRVLGGAKNRLVVPGQGPSGVTVSKNFLKPLKGALDGGTRVLFVFGDKDEERLGEFEMARGGALGEILMAAGSPATIDTVKGTIAATRDIEAQQAIIERAAEWAFLEFGRDPSGVSVDR
jgi:pimeloyl-ACP methyl ester carboxylesterase